MRHSVKHVWHTGREFLTHWMAAGLVLAATGVAPEHWMARLVHGLNIPTEALHLWAAEIDFRWVLLVSGLTLVIGDIAWRRTRPAIVAAPAAPTVDALPLPNKPSIAVLPFVNLSGDPGQEYFSDGITEDIIVELSRFRALFVIARNSTFTYKDKAVDVRQVARELGVHYVLEGSARKAGNRVRVNAQLVDAVTGNHLWAENFDRTLEDVFAVQQDVTRGIVAAVAPEMELAEMAQARRARPNDTAVELTWRAQGLLNEGVRQGSSALVLEAIGTVRQAITADPASLTAYNVLAWGQWSCHLYRWGPDPANALGAMWSAVEHMLAIDALDHRTLTNCGMVRVIQGEHERGLADLRRALEVNPNCSLSLMWLALCEAMTGQGEAARAHATLSLRLNPRDFWIGVPHLALAMVSFAARDYAEAARWAELAIQSEPAVPFRRAIMIACCARTGDLERAARERVVLDGFAPNFMASLFRGEIQVFRRSEDIENLLDGLRLAGVSG
jgi:adenylate cyclase